MLNDYDKQVTQTYKQPCTLYASFYPMYYIPLTRSQSGKIMLSSNCFGKHEFRYSVDVGRDQLITINNHPTTFIFKVLGNYYKVQFQTPRLIDQFNMMYSLQYKEAKVFNTFNMKPKAINVTENNAVYLPQQIFFTRTKALNSLSKFVGEAQCEFRTLDLRNKEKMLEKRRKIEGILSQQGFTERQIKRIIVNMNIGKITKDQENFESIVKNYLNSLSQIKQEEDLDVSFEDTINKANVLADIKAGNKLVYDDAAAEQLTSSIPVYYYAHFNKDVYFKEGDTAVSVNDVSYLIDWKNKKVDGKPIQKATL